LKKGEYKEKRPRVLQLAEGEAAEKLICTIGVARLHSESKGRGAWDVLRPHGGMENGACLSGKEGIVVREKRRE